MTPPKSIFEEMRPESRVINKELWDRIDNAAISGLLTIENLTVVNQEFVDREGFPIVHKDVSIAKIQMRTSVTLNLLTAIETAAIAVAEEAIRQEIRRIQWTVVMWKETQEHYQFKVIAQEI